MTRLLFVLFAFASLPVYGVQPKYLDADLNQPAQPRARFSPPEVESGSFVAAKSQEWEACHQSSPSFSLFAEGAQNPAELQAFIELPNVIQKLETMESRRLMEGRVKKQPWSGDYWPYARGILGSRVLDDAFRNLGEWLVRFQFVTSHSASQLLRTQGAAAIDRFSPSEKYDLLIGDDRGALTSSMWSQGRVYYDQFGKVEEWMGICHGWAPAAMIEPRPSQAVNLAAKDSGWPVPLNPSEIKGLVSYSWATNPYATAFLGQRCNKKDPERDEHGRIIDPDCFDLNPATWHTVVTNRVGAAGKSFIMDATFDYEVWNQPVLAYSYKYFHPQSGRATSNISEASVMRQDYPADPYARYRPAKAERIVGIRMKVAYIIETSANELHYDQESLDAVRWVEYQYDLELDKDGNIVGGEWHSPTHPDFVWTPLQGARPRSALDRRLNVREWRRPDPLPETWTTAAKTGAPHGVILDTITNAILGTAAQQ